MENLESVYGPRNHGSTAGSKRPQRKDTPVSNTFDPFIWENGADLGGGAWVPPTPPTAGNEGVVDVTEGLITSGKPRGSSPSFTKNLMLANRDKESLLEEIIRLKRMLIDQAFYLKRDKVHASTVQIENRKLENDIKDMEMQGMPSYKTQGASRIRAKLQGMKTRYEDLQNVCDAQHEEITHLRRDVRISHTREIEMERDVFVEEIGKLQKDVKRLKALHSQLSCDNKELCRVKDKAGDLEAVNYHLENCMEVVNKALEKANRDVVTYRQRLTESSLQAKRNTKRYKDLQEHISLLEELLEREKLERQQLETKQKSLEEELGRVEQKLKSSSSRGGSASQGAATPNPRKVGSPRSPSPRSARTI